MGLLFPNLSLQAISFLCSEASGISFHVIYSIGWQQTCTLLSSQVIPFSSATTQTILMSFLACAVTLEVVCYLKTQARGWLLDLKNRGTESVGLLLGGRHVLLE